MTNFQRTLFLIWSNLFNTPFFPVFVNQSQNFNLKNRLNNVHSYKLVYAENLEKTIHAEKPKLGRVDIYSFHHILVDLGRRTFSESFKIEQRIHTTHSPQIARNHSNLIRIFGLNQLCSKAFEWFYSFPSDFIWRKSSKTREKLSSLFARLFVIRIWFHGDGAKWIVYTHV